uniref:Uncharacterized protein n=1 Tax=viral metagenome TaxID=1070528 RepID=A0A6C0DCK9_9ZZZZ
MNDYSYDDVTGNDWMSKCAEMTNTIDALNTNIILLNKFIESALNMTDNTNFKENIEITTFDASGNIMACVKSDGSGNFFPCVFMDLSNNMIPCVLPPNSKKKERCFSPYSPYYYPYYPYSYYYPYYSSLLNDNSEYRSMPTESQMKNELSDQVLHSQVHPSYYRPHHRPFSSKTHHVKPPKESNIHIHVHP